MVVELIRRSLVELCSRDADDLLRKRKNLGRWYVVAGTSERGVWLLSLLSSPGHVVLAGDCRFEHSKSCMPA
jgi:hypothetical protein